MLYRNEFFDKVASTLKFGCFTVFRDRQITNSELSLSKKRGYVRVLKSRNISSDGKIVDINGYDSYIDKNSLKNKSVYKFYNNQHVYLVPNMTYNPRMICNPRGVTVNGSVAILVPVGEEPSDEQMRYFSSKEYHDFYQIARNYQTRSLNIDDTSVYFFGLKEGIT